MRALRDRLLHAAIPLLIYAYIRVLRVTMRIEYRGREVLALTRRRHPRCIFAFWHERLLMMPYCYDGSRAVVLVSEHRDGRTVAAILRRFGMLVAAGSSSAGGARGLREMLQRVREGYDVGITPDGPRGPPRRAKSGVIAAARLGGLPIIPVAFAARPARRLGSWDRTLVPRPFARGLFLYGEPIEISRRADEGEVERCRERLERELSELTDRADAALGLLPGPVSGAP